MNDNQDLLDDYWVNETSEPQYVMASRSKRLGNHIIDSIIFSIINWGLSYLILINEELTFFDDGLDLWAQILTTLLSYIIMVTYYTCTEYYLDGKSIGKLATNTRVVRRNGGELTPLRLIGRSFARLIPFEAFSVFFNENNVMWHDSLSDTMVVED